MPEDVVREELKDLACLSSVSNSSVRAAVTKKLQNPLTPHFVSVARVPAFPNLTKGYGSHLCISPRNDLCSQVLSTLRPYAAVLWLCIPVCCLWTVSLLRG
jgi:hypothetical protein